MQHFFASKSLDIKYVRVMFRINDEVSLRKHSHCKFEVYFVNLTHFSILRGKKIR